MIDMIYTKYSGLRDHELIRAVDSNPDATELEIELANRLANQMDDSEFFPVNSRNHVKTPYELAMMSAMRR